MELSNKILSLPSGLGVGDVVYFNVSILNDDAVEEMFENFTVHLNDTVRVSVIGNRYAVVDIMEDETDSKFIFLSNYNPPPSMHVLLYVRTQYQKWTLMPIILRHLYYAKIIRMSAYIYVSECSQIKLSIYTLSQN